MRLAWSALLLLIACAAPAGTPTIELFEFGIEASLGPTAGLIEAEVANRGDFPHMLVVSEADGTVVTAFGPLPAGTSQRVSLDLPAGTYELTCRIVVESEDGRLIDHYQEGMRARIRVSR